MKGSDFTEHEVMAFLVHLHKSHDHRVVRDNYRFRLAEVYGVKTKQKFYDDFPNVPQFLAKMDVEENQNIQMEKFKDCRGDVWQRFCDFTGKSDGFTENDIEAYFRHFPLETFDKNVVEEFLKDFTKKYNEVTQRKFDIEFPKIRDVIRNHFLLQENKTSPYWRQFKKSIAFKSDKDISEEDIKRHFEDLFKTYSDPSNVELSRKQKFFELYSAKLNRNIEEDFPNLNEWITSRCQEIKHSKLISLKEKSSNELSNNELPQNGSKNQMKNVHERSNQEIIWTKLCQGTKKVADFTDSEIIAFYKSEAETKKLKAAAVKNIQRALQKYYRVKFEKNFDEEFPEAFQFVTEYLKKHTRLKARSNNGGHNQGIGTLTKKKKKEQQFTENLWKKLCEMTNKEFGFTDSEMTAFFKLESEKNKWKSSTLKLHQSNFAKLYHKKLGRIFKKDFPKTYLFISKNMKNSKSVFDGKENKDTKNLPHNDDSVNETLNESNTLKDSEGNTRRSEVWKEFCNFTKKSEDFNEKHIIDFMQSEKTKSQRMTNWLYPLAEAYTLKVKDNFWLDFPNVFPAILEKER